MSSGIEEGILFVGKELGKPSGKEPGTPFVDKELGTPFVDKELGIPFVDTGPGMSSDMALGIPCVDKARGKSSGKKPGVPSVVVKELAKSCVAAGGTPGLETSSEMELVLGMLSSSSHAQP